MGLKNEDLAFVPAARVAALVAVADAARLLLHNADGEVITEADWDRLSDVLFTLGRGGEGWAGA